MLPESIIILGIPYKIERAAYISKDEYLLGQIDFIGQKILIDEALSEEKANTVLLHEMIHGIFESLGMGEENQNEPMVQSLATAIYVCLKNNPKFVQGFLV